LVYYIQRASAILKLLVQRLQDRWICNFLPSTVMHSYNCCISYLPTCITQCLAEAQKILIQIQKNFSIKLWETPCWDRNDCQNEKQASYNML
jgi:hypothetical protein